MIIIFGNVWRNISSISYYATEMGLCEVSKAGTG